MSEAQEKIDTLERIILRYIQRERMVRNALDEFGQHKPDCQAYVQASADCCDCGYLAIEKENAQWFGRADDC